ncbi:Ig-like domain-containing protein [Marinivivus vitaminiproducens]|uniref:Ig-like domain-containing protein n=1 Tax=Marinivivus vitaminiproducens TaxID=3035935 RepID=UPI00279CCBE4|nr:Ig-like domain-containing protein [Geminicoccaceae bacterium SCSIO 64248]
MASPIAQDDDITASRTAIRSFDLFADHGNGADSDPDGDRISVSRVENKINWVGKSFALESGARVQIQKDGTLIFNPNGAYDDLAPGESATETLAYTIRDPGGSVDHASVAVTIEGPSGTDPVELADLAGVYFAARGPSDSTGVKAPEWSYQPDGPAIALQDADSGEAFRAADYSAPVAFGETAYVRGFVGDSPMTPTALFRFTDAGLIERVDADLEFPGQPHVLGDHLYVFGEDATNGASIWAIDHTGEASIVSSDYEVPDRPFKPQDFVEANGYLYFDAEVDGQEMLYRLDEDGTIESLDDVIQGSPSGVTLLNPLGDTNGSVYLSMNPQGEAHYYRLDPDDTLTELSRKPVQVNNYNQGEFVLGDSLYIQAYNQGEYVYYAITEDEQPTRMDDANVHARPVVRDDVAYFPQGEEGSLPGIGDTVPAQMTEDGELTIFGSDHVNPVFAETGDKLFMTADKDGARHFYEVVVNGPQPTLQEWTPDRPLNAGETSPVAYDGDYYFYAEESDAPFDGDIWRSGADGSGTERVQDGGALAPHYDNPLAVLDPTDDMRASEADSLLA